MPALQAGIITLHKLLSNLVAVLSCVFQAGTLHAMIKKEEGTRLINISLFAVDVISMNNSWLRWVALFCGRAVANFGLLKIGGARFGGSRLDRHSQRYGAGAQESHLRRWPGPSIDRFVVSPSKATYVRSVACIERAPTYSYVRDELRAHRLWSWEISLNKSLQQPLAMPLTKKFGRRSTREHRTKTNGADETGCQHHCRMINLFQSQEHMSSSMDTSRLTYWTILKTILSEKFFRQLYVKVDRRLDDPTVPKTWTLLESLCQTCLTQEAKHEFIETWDDTCLPLRRVVTRLTRNLGTSISGSEQGDICEECGRHRAYSDFLLQWPVKLIAFHQGH